MVNNWIIKNLLSITYKNHPLSNARTSTILRFSLPQIAQLTQRARLPSPCFFFYPSIFYAWIPESCRSCVDTGQEKYQGRWQRSEVPAFLIKEIEPFRELLLILMDQSATLHGRQFMIKLPHSAFILQSVLVHFTFELFVDLIQFWELSVIFFPGRRVMNFRYLQMFLSFLNFLIRGSILAFFLQQSISDLLGLSELSLDFILWAIF